MRSVSSVHTVSRPGLRYDDAPPFASPSPLRDAIAALLRGLGLDAARAGTREWSPLGELVAPGGRVVVKPNLVSSRNLHQRITGERLAASSTHGSLLRPFLELAARAVGPRGRVSVIDAPVEGCEIERVMGPLGIREVVDDLRAEGHPVELIDLRTFRVAPYFLLDDARALGRSWNLGALVRRPLPGDPRGYRVIDVGEASAFERLGAPPPRALRFHRSHYETPVPHHTGGRHEYSIPQTVLDADLVIQLPKMKTHKKTGVTLALKGCIGLTNEKYWLPHFTAGHPGVGGDELDRAPTLRERARDKLSRLPLPGDHSLVARAPRVAAPPQVIDGSWEGNDTLWRTILDLNRILLFADRDGALRATPQRRYLAVVDGVVAGEGEGPLGATPVDAGLLVGGFHPALVDAVAARAMGLDPGRIVMIREALGDALLPGGGLDALDATLDGPAPARAFRPPRSWPSLRREDPSKVTRI